MRPDLMNPCHRSVSSVTSVGDRDMSDAAAYGVLVACTVGMVACTSGLVVSHCRQGQQVLDAQGGRVPQAGMALPLVRLHTAVNTVDVGQMDHGSVQQRMQVEMHGAGRIAFAQP